jgi:regulator of protease activity HflC (stomatin/prohibitin superfamily)
MTEATLEKKSSKLTLHQRYSNWVHDKWPYLVLTGLTMTLIFVILWHRVVVIVSSGEGGVLYKPFAGGTVIDKIYTEGLYLLLPFNQMTIYNTRVQIIRHEFDVLTNRGLPVTLKIAVRFRPIFELLGVLHQGVGTDYPQKIILPQIESVLRKGLGSHTPEEIYTNKDLLLSRLVSQAIEEIGRKFVIVDDIIIRSVSLPSEVAEAIEQKLVEEQKFLSYTFRLQTEQQEAERKRIEAGGIRDHAKIIQEQLSDIVLKWHGIQATQTLAQSDNSKLIFIGSGQNGLPIMLSVDQQKGAEKPK